MTEKANISIMKKHLTNMEAYLTTTGISINNKKRFTKEVSKVKYWLFINTNK
jgi:hypothetical protein